MRGQGRGVWADGRRVVWAQEWTARGVGGGAGAVLVDGGRGKKVVECVAISFVMVGMEKSAGSAGGEKRPLPDSPAQGERRRSTQEMGRGGSPAAKRRESSGTRRAAMELAGKGGGGMPAKGERQAPPQTHQAPAPPMEASAQPQEPAQRARRRRKAAVLTEQQVLGALSEMALGRCAYAEGDEAAPKYVLPTIPQRQKALELLARYYRDAPAQQPEQPADLSALSERALRRLIEQADDESPPALPSPLAAGQMQTHRDS